MLFFFTAFLLTLGLGLVQPRAIFSDLRFLPLELVQAVAAVGATGIMARVDGRKLSSYGLTARDSLRNLTAGAAAGFAGISLLMGFLMLFRTCQFGAPALSGMPALLWALYWIAIFALVGFSEEVLSRGYPLFALAEGIGFRPAAAVVALLFGLGHLGNGGEQAIGIGNAVIAGLVFAYSVNWSGSLWWAIGAHMSWDWAESYFYGVADSGQLVRHHFLSASPTGPEWLSGGSAGPEGSVLCTLVLALLGVAARFTAVRCPPTFEPSGIRPPTFSPSASQSPYSAGSDDKN